MRNTPIHVLSLSAIYSIHHLKIPSFHSYECFRNEHKGKQAHLNESYVCITVRKESGENVIFGLVKKIPLLADAKKITPITKGYSHGQNYELDGRYLLRLFPLDTEHSRRHEFETMKLLRPHSLFIPQAIEFGSLPETGFSYMILSYMQGKDGEEALQELKECVQFDTGMQAGAELRKLHAVEAPSGHPGWYSVKKAKSDRYIEQLKQMDTGLEKKKLNRLVGYIHGNEYLMKGRPNRFQHDDFHPSNLLIHQDEFSGIIYFQRMDWGDPLHDLVKLGFFSVRTSRPFTIGILKGYFDGKGPDDSFWRLYSLYSAMHIISALVWGEKLKDNGQLLRLSEKVLADHDDFRNDRPSWYSD